MKKPQQVGIFILRIEEEEEEEGEGGNGLFLNNKPSDLIMLLHFLPQRVSQLMTANPIAQAC